MQFDFSVPPNGGQNIDVQGRFLKYRSGLGMIRVKLSKGGYVDMMPGQGVWGVDFSSLNIIDKSGLANSGVILAGEFDFRDDTIVGTVSVVDGGKNSTMQQRCFVGSVNSGAVAGVNNLAALINSASSGKNVVVQSITYSCPSLATVTMHVMGLAPALNIHAINKLTTTGMPSAAFIEPNNIANIGILGTAFHMAQAQGNVQCKLQFAEPMIIPPSQAVVVANGNLAQPVYVNFEFREDPV